MKEPEETTPGYAVGDQVERIDSDYRFEGEVRGIIIKKSGAIRYAVEDDRGVLFTWKASNMRRRG